MLKKIALSFIILTTSLSIDSYLHACCPEGRSSVTSLESLTSNEIDIIIRNFIVEISCILHKVNTPVQRIVVSERAFDYVYLLLSHYLSRAIIKALPEENDLKNVLPKILQNIFDKIVGEKNLLNLSISDILYKMQQILIVHVQVIPAYKIQTDRFLSKFSIENVIKRLDLNEIVVSVLNTAIYFERVLNKLKLKNKINFTGEHESFKFIQETLVGAFLTSFKINSEHEIGLFDVTPVDEKFLNRPALPVEYVLSGNPTLTGFFYETCDEFDDCAAIIGSKLRAYHFESHGVSSIELLNKLISQAELIFLNSIDFDIYVHENEFLRMANQILSVSAPV